MAINKVQFQRGMSLVGFLEMYGSEEACESALFAARWPSGFECSGCLGRSFARARTLQITCENLTGKLCKVREVLTIRHFSKRSRRLCVIGN